VPYTTRSGCGEAGAKGRPTAGNALRHVPYPPCKDVLKFVEKNPKICLQKTEDPTMKIGDTFI
jgi:hypothetical protein